MKTAISYALPLAVSALFLGILAVPGAWAQTTAPAVATMPQNDLLPVKTASEVDIPIDESISTDPAIKLTPDRSEIVKLSKKAAVVLVGNPLHLTVVPEGENMLVLIPRNPGATFFTVLGENNEVIMQRPVIIDAAKEKYVRVRKPCVSSGGGRAADCAPEVYYCPDMCHKIMINTQVGNAGVGAQPSGNGGEEGSSNVDISRKLTEIMEEMDRRNNLPPPIANGEEEIEGNEPSVFEGEDTVEDTE